MNGKKEVLQDSPTWLETVRGFDKAEKSFFYKKKRPILTFITTANKTPWKEKKVNATLNDLTKFEE